MTVEWLAFIIVYMGDLPPQTMVDKRGPYETEQACMERAGEMGRGLILRNPYAGIYNIELHCKERE